MNNIDRLKLYEAANAAEGNWVKWESFGWHDQPADAEHWTIHYTKNRDSGITPCVNHEVFARELAPWEGEDVTREHHGHWAVGWVDGFAVRVRDSDGNITPAFIKLRSLLQRLEDYPILDEDAHSRETWETNLRNIELEGRGMVSARGRLRIATTKGRFPRGRERDGTMTNERRSYDRAQQARRVAKVARLSVADRYSLAAGRLVNTAIRFVREQVPSPRREALCAALYARAAYARAIVVAEGVGYAGELRLLRATREAAHATARVHVFI